LPVAAYRAPAENVATGYRMEFVVARNGILRHRVEKRWLRSRAISRRATWPWGRVQANVGRGHPAMATAFHLSGGEKQRLQKADKSGTTGRDRGSPPGAPIDSESLHLIIGMMFW